MGWGINQYALQKVPVKKPCNGYYLRWYYNGFHYWFFQPGKYSVVTEGEKYYTIGTRKVTMGSGQVTRGQAQGMRTIMMTREVSLLTIAGWMSIRIEPGSLVVYDNKLAGAEIEFSAIIGSKEISYTTGFTPVPIIPVIPPDATSCEIIIGSQIWMCKNFDSNYPGSKVYNNNELYRPLCGGLYTYSQIMNPSFCPAGWHIPTLDEWLTMVTYIGGALTAGGKLKEIGTINWDAPNFGAVDIYGFTQRPTGYYFGVFGEERKNANLWTVTPYDLTKSYFMQMGYDNAQVGHGEIDNNYFLGVRLIKDTPASPFHDWFLPSKDELQVMHDQLYSYGVGGFDADTVYESSSEFDAPGNYGLDFNTNTSIHINKTGFNIFGVRPCRSFISSTVYALRSIGPAGGLVFYKSGNNYLEAGVSDLSLTYFWSNIALLIGTTGTTIGTGKSNSDAIIAQIGHTDSAAKLCENLCL